MSQLFKIHPESPQARLVNMAAHIVREGGVIVYPTDSAYALGCHIDCKEAVDRIRRIRGLDDEHHLTLVCRDLSELSHYAVVSNATFRLLKAHTPGPYTFILRATREVPRRMQHPKRKTIGLRVPDNAIAQALLDSIGQPMISTTLALKGYEFPIIEPEAMQEILGHQVDLVIDGGPCGIEYTTIVDLVDDEPKILRKGKGDIDEFV